MACPYKNNISIGYSSPSLPQRKNLIRNNIVLKILAIEGNKKLLEKDARGKMPRRNKPYHYIRRAGWHLSERYLPLHANDRIDTGFICTWFWIVSPQTVTGKSLKMAAGIKCYSLQEKLVSAFVYLNNRFSGITYFHTSHSPYGKKNVFSMCEKWTLEIVSLGKYFLWSREKKIRQCVV